MKYFFLTLSIFATAFGIIFSAHAATILFPTGGGTGWGAFQSGSVLFGNGTSPIATSSTFQFNNAASRLSFTFGSSTSLSLASLCLTGDTCRTTWPTGGGTGASTTLLGDTNTFSGTDIFSNTIKVASLSGLIGANSGTLYSFASSSLFGYTPLNPTRSLTISGTASQITSSAGAQDLSADRTWTLSLPNHVIFPVDFEASAGTTTNATTTSSQYFTGITASRPLYVDSTGKLGSAGTGTSGNCVNWGANNTFGDAGAACGSGGGATFTYPFPVLGLGTTSPIMLLASTTIGDGTIQGGLTISGNSTTTKLFAVQGVGTSTILDALFVGTSTIGSNAASDVGASRLAVQSRVVGGNALSILSASGVRQVSIDSTGSINATGFTATSLLSGFNLRSALGTAAIPSVSWGNANSSGLFGIASGFALSSNGVERGRFAATGQFGLGTGSTSPQANLDIMLGGTSAVTSNVLAFNIASSSKGLSTTTLFSIDNAGNVTHNGPSTGSATAGTCFKTKDVGASSFSYWWFKAGVQTIQTTDCGGPGTTTITFQ